MLFCHSGVGICLCRSGPACVYLQRGISNWRHGRHIVSICWMFVLFVSECGHLESACVSCRSRIHWILYVYTSMALFLIEGYFILDVSFFGWTQRNSSTDWLDTRTFYRWRVGKQKDQFQLQVATAWQPCESNPQVCVRDTDSVRTAAWVRSADKTQAVKPYAATQCLHLVASQDL
jgi:hypothetical protein